MDINLFYQIIIGLSFIASLSIYFFKNTGFLKFFPPFLLTTFAVEFVGALLANRNIHNGLLYNIFVIIEVPFFLLYIRSVLQGRTARMATLFCTGTYLIVKLADLFLLRANTFHFIAYDLGSLMIVVCCSWFFYENYRLRVRSARASITDRLICAALLLFFAGSLPIYALFEIIKLPSVSFVLTCQNILYGLNYTLYFSIFLAFLLRLRVSNRSV